MEQRSNDAAAKDVLIIPSEEEYAGDTVHTNFASCFGSEFDKTTLNDPYHDRYFSKPGQCI